MPGGGKKQSTMNRKMMATVPKLNSRGGDINKKWFVYYRFWSERSQKYEPIRIYKGFAERKTKAAKIRYANQLIEELTFKLRNGHDPIAEKEADIIFYDEIEYANITNLGGRNKKSNKNVNYWANKYFASISREISKATYDTYQSKLRVFVYYLKEKNIENADITAISTKTINEFFEYLVNVRGIGNSRQMYKEQLIRLFDFIIKQKAIRINPVVGIEIKRKTPQPPRYFQQISLVNMRKYMLANNPQLWLAARFIFYCYIRPHELRFLKVGDILINEGIIRIRANISKNRKERNPVIPENFKHELIEEGILNYPESYFIISTKHKPSLKGVSKNYLWKHFDKVRKDLGIQKEFKFYGFKHTGMIMSKKSGADSKDIQMQAGHHSLDMLDKYIGQMMPVESDFLRYRGPEI